MTERFSKSVLVGAVLAIGLPALFYFAYSRPWYFTSKTYLLGLVFLEIVVAAVWMYRQFFFGFVLLTFLMAGVNLPVGTGWTAARWLVLGAGAAVGILMVLKDHACHFGLFHLAAIFAVLAGLISAAVSLYPDVALLKTLSMLLLFAYAATGARIAVIGREDRFFGGLLIGCEMFVGLNALLYGVGIAAMGNPNSLGAVMGVFGAPILLWGVLLGGKPSVQGRRLLLYALCMYLAFNSHARAGIAVALFSSGVLCVALRRYKLLIEGTVVLVILVAALSIFKPDAISSFASSVVYKNREEGILTSRISPWKAAMDSIQDHPWFGTGLGTIASGDADEERGTFASSGAVTAENGSSYLAMLAGVGLLGAVPFTLLLFLLMVRMFQSWVWMRHTGNSLHPAVPLTIVMFAGLMHAGFEDWLFAPGSYLCVFFWSLAFVLNDVAPKNVSGLALKWSPRPAGAIGGIAPTQ